MLFIIIFRRKSVRYNGSLISKSGGSLASKRKPSVSKVFLSATALAAATLILFEVSINPQFSMPQTLEIADIEQESLFDNCVDEKDRIIHAQTFGNIDNPDVQREILITEKEQAVLECRHSFPEKRVAARQAFRFNIVDLEFRY